MRGHEAIIRCRMARCVPRRPVTLHAIEGSHWPAPGPGDEGYVQVLPTDRPERADLRFVVGLPVIVHGTDRARVEALCAAAVAAKARGVLGFESSRPSLSADYLVFAAGDTNWVGGSD